MVTSLWPHFFGPPCIVGIAPREQKRKAGFTADELNRTELNRTPVLNACIPMGAFTQEVGELNCSWRTRRQCGPSPSRLEHSSFRPPRHCRHRYIRKTTQECYAYFLIVLTADYCRRSWTCRIATPYKFHYSIA